MSRFSSTWATPIIAYCSASICMTLTNKLVLSGFKFKLPFLVLAVQSISSVFLLELFTCIGLTIHRPFSIDDAKNWLPVSGLMAIMLYTGSKSLQFLSVPIFTIFKNISIILVAYGEVKIFGGKVSRLMLLSFVLMVLSSVIAAMDDLSVDESEKSVSRSDTIAGYWWMMLNCVSSASFVLYMRYTLKKPLNTGGPSRPVFKDFDTVFYNNLLTAPMFLLFSLFGADGNSKDIWSYYGQEEHLHERTSFFSSVVFSGISAFWISYTSSWCMRVTNSTTYSMVGALNKLPIAISGLIFFRDGPVTVSSVGSIMLGFISGVIYTVAKLRFDAQKTSSSLPLANFNESKSEEIYIGKMSQVNEKD